MKAALRLLFAAALALGAPLPVVHAEIINAVIVAACGTPPQTYSAGQFQPVLMDTTGKLCTNATGGGGGGTSSNFSTAFPTAGTAIGLSNGTNMVPLLADGSGYAEVDCKSGCTAGSVSNASSGVATSSTNLGSVAYNYAFNGTTWDQLQDDTNKNLKVVLNQGAAVLSATNGLFTNLLQGNAVIANGNPLFAQITAGAAAIGSITNTSFASTIASGADVTLGNTTDAKSTATDTTSLSIMQVAKEISFQAQAIATSVAAAIPSQSPAVPIGGVSVCDGANGTTNPCTTAATVLAASTQSAAANKSIVVQINPNQPNLTTPFNVALAANQSINLAQINGVSAASLMVAASTAPVTATNPALTVDLRPDSPGIIAQGPATTALSISQILNSQYPANSVTTTPTPAVVKATGSTGAVTATIAAVANATAYLCGFDISYVGGVAAVSPVTVTGLLGGTWTYQLPVSATGGQVFSKEFNECLPASGTNTAIAIVTTADGTATAVDVNAHGYTL